MWQPIDELKERDFPIVFKVEDKESELGYVLDTAMNREEYDVNLSFWNSILEEDQDNFKITHFKSV